jgi:hypothetical protein
MAVRTVVIGGFLVAAPLLAMSEIAIPDVVGKLFGLQQGPVVAANSVPAPASKPNSQPPVEFAKTPPVSATPVPRSTATVAPLSIERSEDIQAVPVSHLAADDDARVLPAVASRPVAETAIRAQSPDPASEAGTDAAGQRLEQLGATACRLEKWGMQGNLVRFQCKVPSPRNPNYLRHFEATTVFPADAVRRVTQDVEQWLQGSY